MEHTCVPDDPALPDNPFDCLKCLSVLYEIAPVEGISLDLVPLRPAPVPSPFRRGPIRPYPDYEPVKCTCAACDPDTCAYCGTTDRNCTFCKHRPPVNGDGS